MPDYTLDGQGPFFCRPNASTEDPTKNRMVKDIELRCVMQETGYTWSFNIHNCEHGVLSACTYVNPAHGKNYSVNRGTVNSSAEGTPLRPRNLLVYDSFAHYFGGTTIGDTYFDDDRFIRTTGGGYYITLVNCYQEEISDVTFADSDDRFALINARYATLFDAPPSSAILDGDFSGYKAKAGGALDPASGIKIGAMDHWDAVNKAYMNPRTVITLSNIAVTPSSTGATITFDTDSVSNGNVIVTVHGSGEQIYNGQVEAGHNQDGTAAIVPAQSQAVTGTTQQSVSVTGLSASTGYRVSIIQIGADGYRSAIASRPSGVPLAADFTTTA